MYRTRRKIKKGPIIAAVLIILIGVGGFFAFKEIRYRMSDTYKLLQIGYNETETNILIEKYDKEKLDQLIKDKKLEPNIPKLLQQKYYMKKNMDRYLKYLKENPETTVKDTVSLVNVNRDRDFYEKMQKTDTSKGDLILVNKYYKLTKDFKPKNIVPISNQFSYEGNEISKHVYEKYRSMWNAAKEEGLMLIVNSSYRDYETQDAVWKDYAEAHGEEWADNKAARAGSSEHETGLALDIVTNNVIMNEFENTEEFKWLQNNAYKYGFILRYPKGKENITGYEYESWHYRYVGEEVAEEIHNLDITFDEYYAYYLDK